jgi:hypothetical protein
VAVPDPPPSSPASRDELRPELAAALVSEAARKSRVCWLSYSVGVDGERDRLVWHVWHDDALVVLSGDDGQQLAGLDALPDGSRVEVTMRSKDTGGRLVTWSGSAEIVAPQDERWEGHAGALLGVRLNLRDPVAALARWRESCTVLRVTPLP